MLRLSPHTTIRFSNPDMRARDPQESFTLHWHSVGASTLFPRRMTARTISEYREKQRVIITSVRDARRLLEFQNHFLIRRVLNAGSEMSNDQLMPLPTTNGIYGQKPNCYHTRPMETRDLYAARQIHNAIGPWDGVDPSYLSTRGWKPASFVKCLCSKHRVVKTTRAYQGSRGTAQIPDKISTW